MTRRCSRTRFGIAKGWDSKHSGLRYGNVEIEGHLAELQSVVKMFMDFSDTETFVNPATGGDMQKGPSEPFRTAAGASMIQGMAALPFKDVVRNFDTFTTSVINGLILFNKHFNTSRKCRVTSHRSRVARRR
jgi:hypothetical protein